MACDLLTVAVASPCLEFASARKQKEMLLLLLCAIFAELDGEFSCGNWDSILESAAAVDLTCLSAGQLRLLQATTVCEGLELGDCKALECFQAKDLEAMQVYLQCRIIQSLNP
jgi:hypothetical protein